MPRFSFDSLRTRLLLLVLSATLPALGLTLYTDLEQRNKAVSNAKADGLRLARNLSIIQDRIINEGRNILETLSLMPQVQRRDAGATSAILAGLIARSRDYTEFTAASPDGEVFGSAPPRSPPRSIVDRPYYRRILQTRDFVVGSYEVGQTNEPISFVLAFPVIDGSGEIQVILTATLTMDWFYHVVARDDLPAGTSYNILNREGIVLARYPEPEMYVGKSLPENSILRAIRAQPEGVALAPGLDGIPRIYGFTSFGAPETVSVSVGIPEGVAFVAADRTLFRNLTLLVLVGLLAFAGAWAIAEFTILKWVDVLLKTTSQLRNGNLDARAQLPYVSGELGQLGGAFDKMAEALQNREAELRKTLEELNDYRDHLEEMVIERTRELEDAHKNMLQEQKLKTLGTLSAEMAHEIRNPLMAIGGFAQRLQKKLPDTTEIEIIVREAGRLEGILKRIENYLKPVEMRPSECSVNDIITDAAGLVSPELNSQGIALTLSLARDLSPAYVDPGILIQVVVNVIHNAAKVMRRDGRISIETFESDQNVHISVRAPVRQKIKDPEHVFIPFGEDKEEISVPICFRLLQGMGGYLSLTQEDNAIVFAASLLKALKGTEAAG
jgi:signal transduction histidine kinase